MILTEKDNAPALTHSCDDIVALLPRFKEFKGNDSLQLSDLIDFLLKPSPERAEFYYLCDKEISMISNRAMMQKLN